MSKRKNITISDELAKWYEDKSKDMGISQSNLISIAMYEYITMREDKTVVSFKEFVTEIAKIKQYPEK